MSGRPRAAVVSRVAVVVACAALCASASAQSLDDLFNDSVVQDVHLRISQRDWDTLTSRPDLDTSYSADLVWNDVIVRNIGIRHRGFGTRYGAKPNLRVDVNRYLNDQTFLGLRSLVLDNVLSDASMLRERVAMQLYTRMGIPAPREAHARLFVNEQFLGVYVIVEPVDRAFVTRVFGASEGAPEAGGYLYEYRWLTEYDFSYRGASLEPYAAMFRPQTRDTASAADLYGPLEQLIRRVNETPDDRFETEVGSLVDLRGLARFIATQNCVAETDGFNGNWGVNNFYLYRFHDGRAAALVPWDTDHAFSAGADLPIDFLIANNVLTRRALGVPSVRLDYLSALVECARDMAEPGADGDGRGWLEREIARVSNQIAEAVAADHTALFTWEQFQAEVAMLTGFARARPASVRCQAAAAGGPGADCAFASRPLRR